jgi:hypothetical protein
MDRNPGHLLVYHFTLAGMQPHSDGDPQACDGVADGTGAANGTCRTVKRREECIPCRVDFPAPKAMKLPTDKTVMALQQVTPLSVS